MRGAVTFLVAWAASVGTLPARAATAPPDDIEIVPPRTATSFYGWQIAVFGEAGALATAGALVLPDQPLQSGPSTVAFILGAPTYVLSGPIVHWTHGHFGKGLISLGGNVALPLVAGAIGAAAASDRGFARGVAVGLLLAPIVDGALLGWEEVPIDYIGKYSEPLVALAQRRILPYIYIANESASVGVRLWF
jgi:hypothetical protein